MNRIREEGQSYGDVAESLIREVGEEVETAWKENMVESYRRGYGGGRFNRGRERNPNGRAVRSADVGSSRRSTQPEGQMFPRAVCTQTSSSPTGGGGQISEALVKRTGVASTSRSVFVGNTKESNAELYKRLTGRSPRDALRGEEVQSRPKNGGD